MNLLFIKYTRGVRKFWIIDVKLTITLSVQDEERLREIMSCWRPHTVYHAAAYKHVPLVEFNYFEGIRNNLFGTLNTALLSVECEVRYFVLISTDKAVRPTNVMGASKRLSEMVLQALATEAIGNDFSHGQNLVMC